MEKSQFPVQKRLFELLLKSARNNSNLVQQYRKTTGLSKSPAYNRIKGITPITFDEGMAFMQQAGIHSTQLLDQPGAVQAGWGELSGL
jgi:hypothetical protein